MHKSSLFRHPNYKASMFKYITISTVDIVTVGGGITDMILTASKLTAKTAI